MSDADSAPPVVPRRKARTDSSPASSPGVEKKKKKRSGSKKSKHAAASVDSATVVASQDAAPEGHSPSKLAHTSAPSGPGGSPSKSDDDPDKMQRMEKYVLTELVQTERSYIEDLDIIKVWHGMVCVCVYVCCTACSFLFGILLWMLLLCLLIFAANCLLAVIAALCLKLERGWCV